MTPHWHFGIETLAFMAFGVFGVAHVMRLLGAWLANHGGGTVGTLLGGFFTLAS